MYKVRSEQQISQADEEHGTECAHQNTSKEQITTAFRQHCSGTQACEYGSRSHEGRHNDGWIDEDNLFQQQSQRVTTECTESKQQSQTQIEVFAIVRCEDQSQHKTQWDECT